MNPLSVFARIVLLILSLPGPLISHAVAQGSAIDYYRITNEAELAITRKDLPAAAALYSKAFEINPEKPFNKDLLNAYYCAMDLNDYPTARKCARIMLQKGISTHSVMLLKSGFTGVDSDSVRGWLSEFKNRRPKSNKTVTRLQGMDWSRRIELNRYFMRYPRGIGSDSCWQILMKLDIANGKLLADHFRKDGVLNEQNGSTNYELQGPPVFQRLVEQAVAQPDTCWHGLDTLLFNAAFSFDYHPNYFAGLLAKMPPRHYGSQRRYGRYKYTYPYTLSCFMLTSDSTLYPSFCDYNDQMRNDQRRAAGLETFDELRMKIWFSNTEHLARSPFAKYVLTESITDRRMMYGSRDDHAYEVKEFELCMSKQH